MIPRSLQEGHCTGHCMWWYSTVVTPTSQCHAFTHCSAWPLVWLFFIHHQIAHLQALSLLLALLSPAAKGGAFVHPLRKGGIKIAKVLLGENKPYNPTNNDQNQRHLEVNKQTTMYTQAITDIILTWQTLQKELSTEQLNVVEYKTIELQLRELDVLLVTVALCSRKIHVNSSVVCYTPLLNRTPLWDIENRRVIDHQCPTQHNA